MFHRSCSQVPCCFLRGTYMIQHQPYDTVLSADGLMLCRNNGSNSIDSRDYYSRSLQRCYSCVLTYFRTSVNSVRRKRKVMFIHDIMMCLYDGCAIRKKESTAKYATCIHDSVLPYSIIENSIGNSVVHGHRRITVSSGACHARQDHTVRRYHTSGRALTYFNID